MGSIVSAGTFCLSKAAAYSVWVPQTQGGDNYTVSSSQSRIDGKESEIYIILNFINDHLWFFIATAVFIAIIVTGIKLITGDSGKRGDLIKNAVIGIAAGLLASIFAYAIVRLVTNIL